MPRTERTHEERLIDSALLLSMLGRVMQTPDDVWVGDRLKVMKLAFLATYRMFRQQQKGFNFSFFRYTYGPYSKDVSETWDCLQAASFLKEEEEFSLTRQGVDLARAFWDEVLAMEQNAVFADIMKGVASTYGPHSRAEVMTRVYTMKVVPFGEATAIPVRDIPMMTDLTVTLEPEEAMGEITVGSDWMETLRIALVPGNVQSLRRACDDLKHGRVVAA